MEFFKKSLLQKKMVVQFKNFGFVCNLLDFLFQDVLAFMFQEASRNAQGAWCSRWLEDFWRSFVQVDRP